MNHQLLQNIMDAARGAGKIIKEASDRKIAGISKEGHANFVTKYDALVQEYLLDRLSQILPEAHFVGEEEGKEVFLEEYRQGYTFVIDPIDGTSNFMKGYRPSVTSIGLLKDGRPELGVIYQPYTDEMFWAERGEGAYHNGVKLHTSASPLSDSLVSLGSAPYYGERISRMAFDLGHWYLQRSIDIRRSGTAAWDLCQVASGVTGVFFEPVLCLWDYTAGACILEEAGGKITDLRGRELDYTGKSSILAVSGGVLEGGDYLPPLSMLEGLELS